MKYLSGHHVLNARFPHGNVAGIPDNRFNGEQNRPFFGIGFFFIIIIILGNHHGINVAFFPPLFFTESSFFYITLI